jgi:hypothetical protein
MRLVRSISPAFLIAIGVSALLGAIGGSAFHWAGLVRAWEILTAAFLWMLIASAGTIIGRFFGERVRRGEWRRGLWISAAQSLPLTTVFLGVATPIAAPAVWILPAATPPLYGVTLVVALVCGGLGVLTSPFVR